MSESSSVDTTTITTKFKDAISGRHGVRVSVRDKVRAEAIILKLEPSYVLVRGEWLDLIYLLQDDEAEAGRELVEELEPDNDEHVVVAFDVGSLDDATLHTADADALLAGEEWHEFTSGVIEETLFPAVEPGMSSEPETEDALRTRLIDRLQNGNLNPAQTYALKLAGRGFYPIPVHGIVKKKKSKEHECACQAGKRWYAERNRQPEKVCGSPGKHPTIEGWEDHNASRDPDVLVHLFDGKFNRQRTSVDDGLNIGIVTGPDTGVVVLDIDGPEGAANLAKLESEHGPLPNTVTVVTGSGGRHYYFRAPAGITILNSASKIGAKIDFRGEHGFVVAPPSKHIKGGSYRWEAGRSVNELQPADMPKWLIDLALVGGEKEAAGKGGKKPAVKAQTTGAQKIAHTGDTKGWRGYLADVGDHEGGRGFDGPIWDAMLSFFRASGDDADEAEFMDALGETVASADKSKGDNRDRYFPGASHIAEKLEKARQVIRDTPDEDPVSIEDKGELIFGKSSPYGRTTVRGAAWFGHWSSNNDGGKWVSPTCQAFRVVSVASDAAGGGAAITIEFDTAHNGTQEATFTRAALFDRQEVIKLLAGKWFEFEDDAGTLDLLKSLILPIDTLSVDRTGWNGGAFLHPSGVTLPAPAQEGKITKKLRLGNGTPAGDWRGGTLEGWKTCTATAFEDGARDREQFALGVMSGGAGTVAGFLGMTGFAILNLHGLTSHGKSTSLKLAASASGAPNERGTYQSLRKTDNGMEGILSARSGITVVFDEGKTGTADTLDSIVWMMAHGAGKTRGTVTGEARVGKEFNGFAMTANEIPLAQMLAQGRKSQPGGFYARVCDVDVSGVAELAGDAKDRLFTAVPEKAVAGENIYRHYGHAWEPIARHLQSLGVEHVASALDRLTKELAGPDADAFTTRSANALTLVWYSGIIMQELGLIPACDLERVVRWAWKARAVESTLDPFTRAMETLLTNIATRRGVDIYEWDEAVITTVTTNDDGSRETVVKKPQRYREAVAFIYMDGLDELLLVPRNRLADLCGGNMSGDMIRDQMKERGMLVMSGKKDPKPRWSKLPDEQSVSHYRIKMAELAGFAGE